MSPTPALLVLTTAPDSRAAERLAKILVVKRLAACVTLQPGARSVYRWKEKLEWAKESTLLIKTTPKQFKRVQALLRKTHPYDLPEIIGIPVPCGSSEYLAWLKGSVK